MNDNEFLLDEGLSAFYKGDLKTAVVILTKVRLKTPNDSNILHGLSGALYGLGRYQEALEVYVDFIKQFPDNLAAHEGAGLTYNRLGNKKATLREFRILANLAPDNPIPYTLLSMFYRMSKRYKDAHTELHTAQNIAPTNLNVYLEQGALAEAQRHLNQALDHYKAAISLDPESHYAMSRLGYGYLKLKQYQDAHQFFDRALEVHGNSTDALYGLALAEIGLQQWQNSIARLRRLITLRPGSREAYITLCRIQLRMLRFRDAWSTLSQWVTHFANH